MLTKGNPGCCFTEATVGSKCRDAIKNSAGAEQMAADIIVWRGLLVGSLGSVAGMKTDHERVLRGDGGGRLLRAGSHPNVQEGRLGFS